MKMLFGFALTTLFASFSAIAINDTDVDVAEKSINSVTRYVYEVDESQTLRKHKLQKALYEAPKLTKRKDRIEPEKASQFNNFWIYDAWVELSRDIDFDGFYSRLEVEFDADTTYFDADVYAILYLGVGNTFESFYVTDVFSIQGESSFDTLVVETDFLNGYKPREYELMIELYDAFNDQLVAIADGFSDADLNYLSIESEENDRNRSQVIVVEQHGGSAGFGVLLLGCLFCLLTRFRGRISG